MNDGSLRHDVPRTNAVGYWKGDEPNIARKVCARKPVKPPEDPVPLPDESWVALSPALKKAVDNMRFERWVRHWDEVPQKLNVDSRK